MFIGYLLAHPKTVAAAWTALVLIALSSLSELRYSSDNRVFFAADHPDVLILEQMEAKYTHANQVLVALHSSTGTFAAPQRLDQALTLYDALWRVPGVTRVDALVNYKRLSGSSDELASQNFISPESIASGQPDRAALTTVLTDPVVRGRLLSDDLKTLGFIVTVALSGAHQHDEVQSFVDGIQRVAASITAPDTDLQIHISGMVPLMAAFGEATLRDMGTLIPLALGVAGVMVVMLLGSLVYAAGLLLAAGVSALFSVALWTWLGYAFNTATAIAPIIVMTLCIAAGLHIIMAVRNADAPTPHTRLLQGLMQTRRPSMLALLTTALSFLSFMGAAAPPLQQMGLLVCAGLVVAYAAIYTLMPVMLSALPITDTATTRRLPVSGLCRHQSKLAGGCLAIAILSLPGIFQLTLDDNFSTYFDRSFAYRQAADFTSEHLTGQTIVYIDLPHPDNNTVTDPDYLEATGRLAGWLRTQPAVTSVITYREPLARVASLFPERQRELPRDQAALAEYLLMYELTLDPGESLSDFIAIDRTSSRAVIILNGLSSREVRDFIAVIHQQIESDAYFNQAATFGLSILFAHLSPDNIASMIKSTALSVLCIALLVGALFRSVGYGLACLVLGLLPLAIAFGLWGWGYGELGLPGAVIVGLTIGVLIDDCIHFIHRYRKARQQQPHTQAVAFALRTAGSAVVITSIALICGFAMLCLSGFLINVQLGLFSCMVFALALVCCLGLLPWLLGRTAPVTARA